MQSLPPIDQQTGCPRWLLYAVTPAVLALGFVVGIALAVYLPGGMRRAQPAMKTTPPAQRDSTWQIPTTGSATPSWGDQQVVPDTTGHPTPVAPLFTGQANDAREARLALQSDFGLYQARNISFLVDYQQMRESASGVSVVGLITADEYRAWAKALQEDPDSLRRWLENAAARVQSASAKEGFHLAWAVVDVLRDMPEGFADYEITRLDNRTYLVIRPLASTMDHTRTDISLRPAETLNQSPAASPATSGAPWYTYGPVLRFDNTDLYRPVRATGAKPIR